jgi:electron transfer flavoprotein beta subunit
VRIVVCIKQVPESADVPVDPGTNTLVRQAVPGIINPFDENALEEALRLREKHGGTVTAVSMGPPQAAEILRVAVALGADETVLLSDHRFAGADTFATSYTLSLAVRKIGAFDILLFGKQAIDGDTGQVGPETAEHLGVPLVSSVRRIAVEGATAVVERVTEDGYEVVSTPLPAAFTVVRSINSPRLATLAGKLKSRKYTVPVWTAGTLGADPARTGLNGSPTWVRRVYKPEPRGRGEILQGETGEKVRSLVDRLSRLGLIRDRT